MATNFFQQAVLVFILVVNFLIALYVIVSNPRNSAHRAIFVFVVGIITLGAGMMILFATKNFLFDKLVFLGGYTTIASLFILSHAFPEGQPIKKGVWLHLGPLFILAAATPFNVFIKGLAVGPGGEISPVNGPAFYVFAAVIAGYVAYSIALFIKKYRTVSGLRRLQMQYLFLGATTFALAVFLFNVLLPALGIFRLNLLGPATSIVFVALTAYAIVRHRLLDVRMIVTRAVSFVILIALVASVYALAILFLFRIFARFPIPTPVFAGIVALTTLAMLTFAPLQSVVSKLTKKVFFRGQYETDALLARLTRIMGATIDFEEMTKSILNALTTEMQIGKAAFLIVSDHKIIDTKGVGYHDHEYASPALEQLFHQDRAFDNVWAYEEIDDSLKELFTKLDIAVAIPMKVELGEVAVLILGPKLSGEIYYGREIELLKTFASEAGVAIQNAKSYLQIKKLNEGLEVLVEKRTKELRGAQEKELAKVKEVARLKDEFVFIAVHELRTPVAAIRGFVELIEGYPTKAIPAQMQKYLGSVSGASVHLTQLVDDILEIAQSEAGTTKIAVSPINLSPIVQTVIKEFSSLALERNVLIKLDEQRTIPLISANEDKVREIVSNFISNGIKYNKVGGSLDIRIFSEENNVVIEFKDTGIGIRKDEQDKIFRKFFRSGSKEVRRVRGTGLGLFITRMLAEKIGGRIKFSSVEGQGTTFTVFLPASRFGASSDAQKNLKEI